MNSFRSEVAWGLPGGSAHIVHKDRETYYLDYTGIDLEPPFNNFSGYCYIRKAHEACMAGKWVAVPQNPFVEYHDTKVITGSGYAVVVKKVLKQIEKWKKEAAESDKEPGEHKVQEQFTGEEDSLPFC